ncbi:DUF429 domain-containing protein [Halobacillus shinanisalinarum]|uniref:DUF429 domain-containing protein n=1 Tax=Halobacillus shinanisalinarum TaxID=2932258 RepID=A0ABY4H457_9BACI|nr:DUF429 domain-containing protein [Halobacillus shinanisalinarum]UOQ95246.1 DUF429 domain-containing protein [Halobacillus shinanisalinarum]
MKIVGIDLSGPSNHKDTAVAVFSDQGDSLYLDRLLNPASDQDILSLITNLSAEQQVVVGIDAPLSYEDGGGDRELEKELRSFTKELGMKSGSIMPPTLTKMIYLTVRGMKLASLLSDLMNIQVIEVHPGATLAARIPGEEGRKHALLYKRSLESRDWIANWMISFGLKGIQVNLLQTSHLIDSCAAAIAAWDYVSPNRKPAWSYDANSPYHPYPFSC